MNRKERRAFERKTGLMTRLRFNDHKCDTQMLSRYKALDYTIPPGPCNDHLVEDCPNCTDGTMPAMDFLGYKCPTCGIEWVRMSLVRNGTTYTSWRTAAELLKSTKD